VGAEACHLNYKWRSGRLYAMTRVIPGVSDGSGIERAEAAMDARKTVRRIFALSIFMT
jgi:hypothetical protein